MLETQKFLRENELNSLKETYHITSNRHSAYPNLVQLKYSQIDSKMTERIVQECRGLILDEANNWEIVSYPFDKFFNYNESNAAKLDWENATVFEKLDGSLMVMYYYNDQWQVGSSGLPDASGNVRNQEYNLNGLFQRIWKESGYESPKNKTSCYMFEMVDPSTKVLVPYKESRISLIGVRDLKSLKEYSIDQVENNEWQKAKRYPLQSLEKILEECKALNPMQHEGYVVCDSQFRRVKIKSPQYVKLSLIQKNTNPRLNDKYLVEIIQANEGEEFLSYFESYRTKYNALKNNYNHLIESLEEMHEVVKGIDDRKEIALKVKGTSFPSVFFQLKDGKAKSVKDYIRNQDASRLLNALSK